MRLLAAVLFALLILAPARSMGRYELAWESALPLDPQSIQATITGGELLAIFTTADGTRGWVQATAPRACLTIQMDARTTGGAPVRIVRSWDADCNKLVAFGDSITVGMKASTPALGWAVLYATEQGLALDNRAVSGSTVAQQELVIKAYQGNASEAIWFVCANDLYFRTPAQDFGRAVQAGVNALAAKGIAVTLNATCPHFPRKEERGLREAYDAALSQIVGAHQVDLFLPSWAFDQDNTHLNDAGHRALASAYLGRWQVWMPAL